MFYEIIKKEATDGRLRMKNTLLGTKKLRMHTANHSAVSIAGGGGLHLTDMQSETQVGACCQPEAEWSCPPSKAHVSENAPITFLRAPKSPQ